ncbi:MarR family winged helix-turn-helix transcriptional regulator [Pedobacter sp. BMA]|uniref:MarR family winged helix-turn-helix transcriptional regulator n=1 Tax=Pedobacter sp. BMA TaxID=1663685 RepID=UPI000649B7D9|nr:MarR family winged helix-turn-helix transcriptional regulator [Pedobacter sp. BMA]KLT67229.1 hypothetical protein AB669_00430 [Pedobacter sp. BMA]
MMYNLVNELLVLVKRYETSDLNPQDNLNAFHMWLNGQANDQSATEPATPEWTGKASGRSADSVINTSLVHLYRYAKNHARNAIAGSNFSTPDEFIYLISLLAAGSMSKSALIKHNIHDKPAGTLIIKRLFDKGLIEQEPSNIDKRSSVIRISHKGTEELEKIMDKIRLASASVTEPLSPDEKIKLITLLQKLENFHHEQVFEKHKILNR